MSNEEGLVTGPDAEIAEAELAFAPMVPHPIEGGTVHFRAKGRCMAAIVVDINAVNPLDPDFVLDLVVFQPRVKRPDDRFVNDARLPGNVRWANDIAHAHLNPGDEGQELTWHWPGQGCIPMLNVSIGG